LVADVTSCMQQAGDLLGCAWPAPLGAAARPLEPVTWLAGMAVITDRCCGQPGRLRTMGYDRFLAAVRRELPRWGGKFVRHSIVRGLREALADTGGVAVQRRGALERLHLLLGDWRALRARLTDTETAESLSNLLCELGQSLSFCYLMRVVPASGQTGTRSPNATANAFMAAFQP
jgi:transposase